MVITDKVKKILLKALAVVMILLGLGALGWWGKLQYDYVTYRDEKEGLGLRYPRGWEFQDHPQPNVIAIFLSPRLNALQVFRENINVSIMDLHKEPLTIQQYAEIAANQLTTVFEDTVLETKSFLKISGHDTVKFVFHAKGDQEMMVVVYSFIYRDIAYTLTYIGTAEQYALFKTKLEHVMNSVKLFF